MPTAAPITPDFAADIAPNDFGRVLAQRERPLCGCACLAPAFFALLATTTFPLFFLVWTSAFRMDLAMPFTNGFVGFENYRVLLADERFWSSLLVSLVYTSSTVILQVVIGLALALLVMDMKRGQGLFRLIAILPVVLSPAVVGMIWRTFMLAPEFGIVDFLSINAGLGSQNWLGDPLLAMVSVIAIHTWQWTPFAFMVLLASLAALPEDIYEAARLDRASAWQRFRRITLPLLRPAIVMVIIMRTMVALTAFRRDLHCHRRRSGNRDRNPQSLCLPEVLHRAVDRLWLGARGRASRRDHHHLRHPLRAAEGEMNARRLRIIAISAISFVFLLAWAFPILWSVLNSLKTDSDVLAYPPRLIFSPTLDAYRDVLFGSQSILPNLISSLVISVGTTVITMLMAVPAAYALARLRFRAKKFAGFYVLATQMLPPVGIIIPYFLVLRNIGWIDTYQGIILIYLSFSLPFAIWLLVSYFEDIPFEMEEAAYLDGASRLRTLWRIIIPQVRGGIAVTIVFVFLNAWNEFLFAVVLSGNTVRPVTVAMFNFVSVEQTLWAKLAAVSVLAMLPVVVLGIIAQKHIVKGLTLGAVKGGGRR